MVLSVKNTRVASGILSDRRPGFAAENTIFICNVCVYDNIVYKHRIGRGVLRCAVFQRTVYKGGKPIKVTCVLDLIYAVYQFGRFIPIAHRAESVVISVVAINRFRCICIGIGRLTGIVHTTGIYCDEIYCTAGIIRDGVSVCTECLIPALCTVGYTVIQKVSDLTRLKLYRGFCRCCCSGITFAAESKVAGSIKIVVISQIFSGVTPYPTDNCSAVG